MSERTAHVIGAGLAGLAAATSLVDAGWCAAGSRLRVYEAAAQAGGRCRSYYEAALGLVIDNGNHLALSGNSALARYMTRIGAADRLTEPADAAFAFADLNSGDRWKVRFNAGRLPWWIMSPRRRVPGTRTRDYLALLGLSRSLEGRSVSETIACQGELWRRFLRPVLLAVLNTPPENADAGLAAAVLRESLGRGGDACRPRIAARGLAAAFVDPALGHLRAGGAEVLFNRRLRKLEVNGYDLVTALHFDGEPIPLGAGDIVVLAVPPWVAGELVSGLLVPDRFHAIVNGHFRVTAPAGAPAMLGLLGGTAEWIFAFPEHLSVTVSGADALLDADRETLARRLWRDVARVYDLPDELPPWQIIKERRATFAATSEQQRRRPGSQSAVGNLFLAGDWVRTGLPATIEGAIRSGEQAAALVMGYGR